MVWVPTIKMGRPNAVFVPSFRKEWLPYIARGEDQYDAFRGAFRGTFFGPRGRPVTFLVPADLLEEARLLLKDGN